MIIANHKKFTNEKRIPWGAPEPEPPKGEISIVWLEDPSKFFFVRTRIFNNHRRSTKPAKGRISGRLIGYSVLSSKVKQTKWNWPDAYERRLFYLTELDLKKDCGYLKHGFHPSEGVDPMTVKPGVWGVHLQPTVAYYEKYHHKKKTTSLPSWILSIKGSLFAIRDIFSNKRSCYDE